MKTSAKVAITTLAVAVPAFLLGAGSPQGEAMWRAAWPWDMHVDSEPGSGLVPLYMALGVFEALSLGLAVAFLAFGRAAVRRLAGEGWRFNALYFGSAWVLGNWWVHDSLHLVNGMDWTGLLVIEYAFHVTLILVGALVCWALATLALARPAAGGAAAPR